MSTTPAQDTLAAILAAFELTPDEAAGVRWWSGLTEKERSDWLERAGRPVDAWAEHKRGGAANMNENSKEILRGLYMRAACDFQQGAIEQREQGNLAMAATLAKDARLYLAIANASDPFAMAERLDGTFGGGGE